MASKKKSISPTTITLKGPAGKKLADILSAPQSELRKETVAKSTGLYSYYREKWTKSNK